jgi:hypothetical protein
MDRKASRKETHLELVKVAFCAFCNDLGIGWLALLGLSYGFRFSLELVEIEMEKR